MNVRVWIACFGLALLGAGHAEGADAARREVVGTIRLEQVRRVGGVEYAADGVAQRRYTFAPAARPSIVLVPRSGTWDWSDQGELHLRVQNAMPWAVTFDVEIDSAGQRLQARVGLPPGPAQTLVMPLRASSSRVHGMQVGPSLPFDEDGQRILLATTVRGALDRRHVHAIRLGIPSPQAAQTLLLGGIGTLSGETGLHAAYAGIVDRYGQSTRAQWPQKIDSDAALRAAVRVDAGSVAPAADAYGGQAGPALDRTGWFHAQKQGSRWWLVTPDGHAFFSLGVNAVNADGGRSYVEGREFMFAGLPPDRGAWAAFYGRSDSRRPGEGASQGIAYNHGRWFDFYAANLHRIDGSDWLAVWRKRALDRLQAWGFNTLGNWSDAALGRAHRLPYTRSINIAGDYASVASGYDYWGRMPDPFDPRFAAATEAAVAKASAGVADDPWLLGYFADNELAWAGEGPQGRWGLALGTLAGDAHSPSKRAFIAMLRQQYATPHALGEAWGIALRSWDALQATGYAAPAPNEAHPALARDYGHWLRRYADTYFRTVAAAIRRHDPHHLFLGGRFAVYTPEAVAACAHYCDVVSFNAYAELPQHHVDMALMRTLDRPVLLSEFHFGSNDRGPFGAGVVPVADEAARGAAYARYLAAATANPWVVGAHWFEYADQPLTGRLLDGENSHIGLVGITDIPFGGFVQAVREANRRARSRTVAEP
ncbi:MAG: beta-galactosidase [Rhodanobacter lindaniclasticus]